MTWKAKAAFFIGSLRRTWPEWIAAFALAWLLRDIPRMAWWHGKGIVRLAPLLRAEGGYRIPPSKAEELKGTYPGIGWINAHIPRDQPLLYIGRMSRGIRFRYYTFPRASHWHYIYANEDLARTPEAIQTSSPAYVLMEQLPILERFPRPENWREIWSDSAKRFRIYEVADHATE